MLNKLIVLILFGTFISLTEAKAIYKIAIPNSNIVPHPCIWGQFWSAFGHETICGGHLNSFGRDFNAQGRKWTPTLCRMDSDGDGKTNGQELGDPNCIWTPPEVREKVTPPPINDILSQLSHPGVCEPIDSPRCRANNTFLLKMDECALIMNGTMQAPTSRLLESQASPQGSQNGTASSGQSGGTSVPQGGAGGVPVPQGGQNGTGVLAQGGQSAIGGGSVPQGGQAGSGSTSAPQVPRGIPAALAGELVAPGSSRLLGKSVDPTTYNITWCPAIAAPEVKMLELRFNKTHLPPTESTLLCQKFVLPDDAEYQIIAWEPIKDSKLLHQIALMTCDAKDEERMAKGSSYTYPQVCSMAPRECSDLGLIWSEYLTDRRCYGDEVGFPMGKSAFPYQTVLMQLLYDNPSQLTDVVDSSGMRIFYTSKKRANNVALRGIGQMDIMIPPKSDAKVTVRAFNSESCSRSMLVPFDRFYFSSLIFHVRKLATHVKLDIRKANGTVITLVDRDVTYQQPAPMQVWNNKTDAPFLEPGDDLAVECSYSGKEKEKYTFFGGGVNDETCFIFAELYPTEHKSFGALYSLDDINPCLVAQNVTQLHDCSNVPDFIDQLTSIANSSAATDFMYSCYAREYPVTSCALNCYKFLQSHNLLGNGACVKGPVFRYLTLGVISDDYDLIYRYQSHIERCLDAKSEADTVPDIDWCPAIKGADVKTIEFRANKAPLWPTSDYLAYCQKFVVPDDDQYQIIAWEPIVDHIGTNMLQHIMVMACDTEGEQRLANGRNFTDPQICEAVPRECNTNTFFWSPGQDRRCYSDNTAFPMGLNAFRTGLFQLLFDNLNGISNMTDSSGIRFYYTAKKRQNELAMLALGQMDVIIPPKSGAAKVSVRPFMNSTNCSRQTFAPESRYRISSLHFHARQFGSNGKFRIRKADGSIVTIFDQRLRSYYPTVLEWSEKNAPIIEPGDDFDIECTYNTTKKTDFTFMGESLNANDMCFAFIEIFPRPNNKSAQLVYNMDDMNICLWADNPAGPSTLHACNDVKAFVGELATTMMSPEAGDFVRLCKPSKYPAETCSRACYEFLQKHNFLKNPCLQGSVFRFLAGSVISPNPTEVFLIQSQTDRCQAVTDISQTTTK